MKTNYKPSFLKHDLRLSCFSPPVMLATFIIEITLAIYTLWRYKLGTVTRLVIAMLVFLATFQIAEFNVCASGWIDPLMASRIGFCAITMLPPLGLHLVHVVSKIDRRVLVRIAYASAACFILFFLFVGHSLSGNACLGNYVIFQMAPGSSQLYGMYYYLWLLAGIWISFRHAEGENKGILLGTIIGYVVFLLPTATVNFLIPTTIAGAPSIMCGFAVFFALLLVLWILPRCKVECR
jgi:hypothetical protein